MRNRDIVLKFLELFCSGDIASLRTVLAEDLIVRGTLYSFNSADEYLASLTLNPPEKSDFTILGVTENTEYVSVFYDYHKPDGDLTVAQLFKITDQRIREMTIVFDSLAVNP